MIPTFFVVNSENLTSILSYVKDMFDDFKLPVLVLCGLGLGMWIIEAIVDLIQGKKDKHWFTEEGFEEDRKSVV